MLQSSISTILRETSMQSTSSKGDFKQDKFALNPFAIISSEGLKGEWEMVRHKAAGVVNGRIWAKEERLRWQNILCFWAPVKYLFAYKIELVCNFLSYLGPKRQLRGTSCWSPQNFQSQQDPKWGAIFKREPQKQNRERLYTQESKKGL